jgi:glycosyltransferase involved in cell wall biosynthesis
MEHPCLVSNPWLQSRYGGTLIPHAREDVGAGRRATSRQPLIAFVGTNRQHKGMGVLRAAVDTLQSRGFTLVVTDTRPPDAKPWESWIGSTSFAEGMEVVRSADIVAIPSLRNRHSEGQLPAKLIDAMLLARAVVVTDVEPMPWAVAGTGLVVPAGSRDQLVKSLARLVDPALRDRLGLSARERALREFTVASLAGRFRDACLLAADTSPQARDD